MTRLHLSGLFAAISIITLGLARGNEPAAPDVSKADSYIDAALRYDEQGEQEFRNRMLLEALQIDPNHELVHGLLGNIRVGDQWAPLSEAQKKTESDQKLAEYRELRANVGTSAARLGKLARWCQRNGFEAQALVHYRQLLAHPEAGDDALKEAVDRLGLSIVNGELMTREEIALHEERAKRYQTTVTEYGSKVALWQRLIDNTLGAKKDGAVAEMDAFDEPDIALLLPEYVNKSGNDFGVQCIAMLAKIDSVEAIDALLAFALGSPHEEVRGRAIVAPKKRDVYDYVPKLLDRLLPPLESKWQITQAPDGTINYEHTVVRRDRDQDIVLAEDTKVSARQRIIEVPSEGNKQIIGLKSPDEHEFKQAAIKAKSLETAAQREHQIAEYNKIVLTNNAPVYKALEGTTGVVGNRYPNQWYDWWQKYTKDEKERKLNYRYVPIHHCYNVDIMIQNYEERSVGVSKPKEIKGRPTIPRFSLRGGKGTHTLFGGKASYSLRGGRGPYRLRNNPPPKYTGGKFKPGSTGGGAVWDPRDQYKVSNWLPRLLSNAKLYRPGNFGYYPLAGTFQPRGTSVLLGSEIAEGNGCLEGTLVWTESGSVAIENLQAGDRVVTRNIQTGSLSMSVIDEVKFFLPTSEVKRISVAGESLKVTAGFTIWENGSAWQLADQLEVGSRLHGIHKTLEAEHLQEGDRPDGVYHLVVEDNHCFFIGEAGVLVHDATKRQHVAKAIPGLQK